MSSIMFFVPPSHLHVFVLLFHCLEANGRVEGMPFLMLGTQQSTTLKVVPVVELFDVGASGGTVAVLDILELPAGAGGGTF